MISTALLVSYPGHIGRLFYRHENIGDLLYMLSFSCIFIYLHQTLTGVLNGLGKQGALLLDTVVGSLLRIAVVYFLVPAHGIQIYIKGMAVSFAVTSLLNMLVVNKTTGLLFNLREWLLKPGLAALAIVLASKYIYCFCEIS